MCNAEEHGKSLLPTVMRLIGMLDSPYVRRVAISMDLLGVPFTHEPLSVFKTFEQFQQINPVVKAPTLICTNGDALMDSTLILQFVEATHPAHHSLWSSDAATLQREMRCVGLALAACEKGVQIVYERNLRPKDMQFEPWMERVRGQLLAACSELEREIASHPMVYASTTSHACITTAVIWQLTQSTSLAVLLPAADYPAIDALATRMEASPAFLKYPPVGPGV